MISRRKDTRTAPKPACAWIVERLHLSGAWVYEVRESTRDHARSLAKAWGPKFRVRRYVRLEGK